MTGRLRRSTRRPASWTAEAIPILRKRSRLTVWQSLGMRALLVAALLGIALLGHWLDRDGLRDNVDGLVSFSDIVYFTAVTVTTVGYGDIVPVTDSARMFDTFVVTPIRLFVWLIFLGSAYSFILQHSWDRIRTRMIARALKDHFIICGFGASGAAATDELLREGIRPDAILVIDSDATRVDTALSLGVTALCGDATHNVTLEAAEVAHARAVLISIGRDDTAALVVLSVRQLNPAVPISVNVRASENEDLLRQAGAAAIINPVSLGGHLLARSATNRHAVDYLRDLAAEDGRVAIRQRVVASDEIGRSLASLSSGMALRIIREGSSIGYWESPAEAIEADDVIVEVVRIGQTDEGSLK